MAYTKDQKEVLKTYPRKLFCKETVDTRCLGYDLTAIENHMLSAAGILVKMEEWQRKEGGVDSYIYDRTASDLKEHGVKMPKHIKRKK